MTERLDRTATVTLDGSGTGTLVFGPGKYAEQWKINRITTEGNSVDPPKLDVYRGAPGGSLIDTTDDANADISETQLEVRDGESITAVYSLGTPASIMRCHIEGEITRGI